MGLMLILMGLGTLSSCTNPSTARSKTTLIVFAASSLTAVSSTLEQHFEQKYPHLDLQFHLAGSQMLVQQVFEGAPADVIALADPLQTARLHDAGLSLPARRFAGNHLVFAVPHNNPATIRTREDITKQGVKIVLAGPSVPAGHYARSALQTLGMLQAVENNLVSNEHSARGVIAKLELGEVDAGIVYTSDLHAHPRLHAILPRLPVEAHYEAAPIVSSASPTEAKLFLDELASPAMQAILLEHGFSPASPR